MLDEKRQVIIDYNDLCDKVTERVEMYEEKKRRKEKQNCFNVYRYNHHFTSDGKERRERKLITLFHQLRNEEAKFV